MKWRSRSLRALLVDVGPARRGEIAAALDAAGWNVHAEPVAGTEALSAALARRGWDVVIYGGEGEDRVPARKAMALVRMADPQLAFVAAVASVRPGDLSAFVQGFGPEAIFAPDPARLPEVLEPVLAAARGGAARRRRRPPAAARPAGDHRPCRRGARARRAVRARARDARPDAGLDLRRRLAARRRVEHAALHRAVARPGADPHVAAFAEHLAPAEDRPRPRPARAAPTRSAARRGSPTSPPTATWRATATRSARA